MRFAPLLAALALAACVTPALSEDEIAGVDWLLVGLEGQTVDWAASLRIEGDKLSGKAPCNRWFGTNAAALPAVAIQGIGATKMACPDLAAESAYFETLQAMQAVEADQERLFLIGPEGRTMEFARDADAPCLSCRYD